MNIKNTIENRKGCKSAVKVKNNCCRVWCRWWKCTKGPQARGAQKPHYKERRNWTQGVRGKILHEGPCRWPWSNFNRNALPGEFCSPC